MQWSTTVKMKFKWSIFYSNNLECFNLCWCAINIVFHAKYLANKTLLLLPWLSGAGLNFINVLHTAIMLADPESVKDTDDLPVFVYTFGIYKHKSCT